jgi:hypothetical protein
MNEQQTEAEQLQELLNSVSPESRGLIAELDLGEQAEEFISSDIGRYMVGAAQQDGQDAHEKLSKTLPFRWRRIQALQNEIRISDMFLLYLRDLIIRGRAAGKALEDRDET